LAEVNGNFAALDAAVAEAAVVPYVIGSYVGTSKAGNKIELGFRPSYLIIGCPYGLSESVAAFDAVVAFDSAGRSGVLTVEDDGFIPILGNKHPRTNTSGTTYVYIAFR
jgi:hypothetical protein